MSGRGGNDAGRILDFPGRETIWEPLEEPSRILMSEKRIEFHGDVIDEVFL